MESTYTSADCQIGISRILAERLSVTISKAGRALQLNTRRERLQGRPASAWPLTKRPQKNNTDLKNLPEMRGHRTQGALSWQIKLLVICSVR